MQTAIGFLPQTTRDKPQTDSPLRPPTSHQPPANRPNDMHFRHLPALAFLSLFFFACSISPMQPSPPQIAPKAERRLAELAARNEGLATFKGIGTLRLFLPEGRQTARAAWIARPPDRLRLELLGAAGTPLASMAADGGRFDLYLHDRARSYRRHSPDDSIERIIGVPLKVAELVSLLGGRVPVEDFQKAIVVGDALVLSDAGGRVRQTIRTLPAEGSDLVIERFDADGQRCCRIHLADFRAVDGFSVPGTIRVTDGQGERLRLSVDRFWANPDVVPGVFALGGESPAGGAAGGR
jgi:outer membrane biogenesis lipoprotein LolB